MAVLVGLLPVEELRAVLGAELGLLLVLGAASGAVLDLADLMSDESTSGSADAGANEGALGGLAALVSDDCSGGSA